MKTFYDLTQQQQIEAIEFAKNDIAELVKLGLLSSNKQKLNEGDIQDLAQAAAEGGQYNDEGKPHVEKMEVPYYFLGGCV